MDPIVTDLNELAKLQDQREALRLAYEAKSEAIIQPLLEPVRAQLDDLDNGYREAVSEIDFRAGVLTERIKGNVLATGESVKGDELQAIYTKPRITWDSRGLEGFMVAHPEIVAFRKVGQASVSLRKVAKGR